MDDKNDLRELLRGWHGTVAKRSGIAFSLVLARLSPPKKKGRVRRANFRRLNINLKVSIQGGGGKRKPQRRHATPRSVQMVRHPNPSESTKNGGLFGCLGDVARNNRQHL